MQGLDKYRLRTGEKKTKITSCYTKLSQLVNLAKTYCFIIMPLSQGYSKNEMKAF